MDENDAAGLVDDFTHLRLPRPQWTHEAHLVVCRAALRRLAPADALDHLRRAIRAYNEATGGANTDHGGYHETLTAYYVGAVHALGSVSLDALVSHSTCAREAPAAHWSRARLFSVAARRAWVPPDLAPVPWSTPAEVGNFGPGLPAPVGR